MDIYVIIGVKNVKKYIKEKNQDQAFSLHDARVIDFGFDYEAMSLRLVTSSGYVSISENKMVEGNIVLEEVSLEDSYVYILDYKNVLCGNVGSFVGEKMTLDTFISAYPNKFAGFDIMSEYDGYLSFVMD